MILLSDTAANTVGANKKLYKTLGSTNPYFMESYIDGMFFPE